MGWHGHPSEPAVQGPVVPVAVVPAGISHFPETQMPLAQSGPVLQLVFGSSPVVSQRPPVHLPLWQSLACVHNEPLGAAPPLELPESAPP
jgi:hypothetical protein